MLRGGQTVLLHSIGGLGRSGVVAAALCMDMGCTESLSDLLNSLRACRGDSRIPETEAQLRWLQELMMTTSSPQQQQQQQQSVASDKDDD